MLTIKHFVSTPHQATAHRADVERPAREAEQGTKRDQFYFAPGLFPKPCPLPMPVPMSVPKPSPAKEAPPAGNTPPSLEPGEDDLDDLDDLDEPDELDEIMAEYDRLEEEAFEQMRKDAFPDAGGSVRYCKVL